MKSYKEKQYLIFEFNNGKNVKYDLSNGYMIGKKGYPVKGLSSQLSGLDISELIESFQDDKYRQFLKFVHSSTTNNA